MTSAFAQAFAAASPNMLAVFGEWVELLLEGQEDTVGVRGIFSARHQEVDPSSGIPVSAVQPMLEVWGADLLVQPTEGDSVTVRGQRYLIVDCQPDGHGFLRLMLHRS